MSASTQTLGQLTPPPGYRQLVAFDRHKHSGLGVDEVRRGVLSRESNAIFITAAEFFQAARHYPVVFTRASEDGELLCVVVTSFREGANVFVDESGAWAPGRYVPAYVRRFPFHTVGVQRDGKEPDFLICVDDSALIETSAPLFDADGNASKAWSGVEALIRDMEVARRQTRRLLEAIDELDVLVPFDAQGVEKDGRAMRLTNLLRVDEEKLNALPAGTVKALMAVGALGRIYAHLMSLDNFAFLLEQEVASGSTRT